MKTAWAAAAFALALAGSATAAPQSGEVGYPQGALGYDALVQGDFRTAEIQLQTSPSAANDPARLINMGYLYLRTGRIANARQMFEAARDSRDHFDVELANGTTADSRDVATRALARLTGEATRYASR